MVSVSLMHNFIPAGWRFLLDKDRRLIYSEKVAYGI